MCHKTSYTKLIAARSFLPSQPAPTSPPSFPSLLTCVRRLFTAEELKVYVLRRNPTPKPYLLEAGDDEDYIACVYWHCWSNLEISLKK